ncbi:MAG TPA: response regulator [Nitrospira sp.]|nr:response regulator [Nitrospira sp.]
MVQPTVLIVEDEAIVAEDLTNKVTALGYEVIDTVPTGEQALPIAQTRHPDLVLLDLKLAGNIDGIQTAERLLQVCDLAIVFVTAHSDRDTVKRASATVPFGYILKPFSERDLSVQLDTALYKHRANKALRENEERLRQANAYLDLAQKAGSVGFFDYHFDRDLSVWTEGLADLFGISLAEYEGTWDGWAKRVVPEDAESVRQAVMANVSEGREHVAYEFRAILPNGTIRWLAGRGRIFYGPDSKPLRMTGVTIDLSERKHVEQKLGKSEDILLRAQRGAKAGVWEIDLRSNRLTWSEPYYDLFGVDHSLQPSVDVWLSCIHPEDRGRIAAEHRQSVKEKRDQSMEFRIVKPDGNIRWIHRKGQVEFNDQGDAIRINGISFDITERKEAENAVQTIALFPAQNPSPVLRVSKAGILLYMNPASGQLLRELHLVVGETVPLYVRDLVQNSLQTTRSAKAEHDIGGRHYLITITPIAGGDYANLYWTDITERKQAEIDLQVSQMKLERFAEELELQVAHRTQELVRSQEELRHLATELNLTEQRERKRLAAELHDHLQQLLVLGKLKVGQVKRFAETVPTLVTKSIYETDELLSEALTYTRTLVAELSPPVLRDHGLSAALKWLGGYMKKHNMTVKVTVPEPDGLALPEDQAMLLFQSVRELLINTSKHARTHEAWLTLKTLPGQLLIEVKDYGIGFVPASETTAALPGGLSSRFGLFSIRERMKALGGSLDVQSSPGKGTTATLTLPLFCLPGEHESTMPTGDLAERKFAGHRREDSTLQENKRTSVLLVDDHAMVRQGLRAVLEGYDDVEIIGEACDGEEAVAAVCQLHPQVVIMDINMPRLNGIEATAEIKARYPDISVIGLSVNSGGDNRSAMLRAGASALLTKEAAVDELYKTIQRALAEKGMSVSNQG